MMTLPASGCRPVGFPWPEFSGARRGSAGSVQLESTATRPDDPGSRVTPGDDDLRGWTRVDVLPADGMQEIRGSNPLSSTSVVSQDIGMTPNP